MEIGWYLRFARVQELEFLVGPGVRAILDDQQATVSGWRLAVETEDGFLRALFTREKGPG